MGYMSMAQINISIGHTYIYKKYIDKSTRFIFLTENKNGCRSLCVLRRFILNYRRRLIVIDNMGECH